MAHDADNFERSYIVYIENIIFSIDQKIFFLWVLELRTLFQALR